jgi:hypothetical protein
MTRTASDAYHARRLDARRREDRGIVASYVHQLSERHLTAHDGARSAGEDFVDEEATRDPQADP